MAYSLYTFQILYLFLPFYTLTLNLNFALILISFCTNLFFFRAEYYFIFVLSTEKKLILSYLILSCVVSVCMCVCVRVVWWCDVVCVVWCGVVWCVCVCVVWCGVCVVV